LPVVKLAATKDGRRLANYLQRDDQGQDRAVFVSEGNSETHGRVNSAQHAEKDFQAVREQYGKTDGVQAHMAYISFKRDDLGDLARADGKPDWDKIEQFGHEYARRAGIAERHQYYIVAHDDKANPHLHIIWNAVSDKDGSKYHSAKNENIERMRDVSDALSREHGIQHLPERDRNPEKVPDAVIRGVQHGQPEYSWKRDLQYRIKDAASHATSYEDFRERLRKQGVEVRERGNGVSYSFKDNRQQKHVARGSRLGEAYTRADIERRFAYHQRLIQTPGEKGVELLAKELKHERTHFTSWQQEMRSAFREAEQRAHSPEEFRRLAQERGLTVQKDAEGHYQLQYHDRYGVDHTAGPDVLRKGTTDQAVEMRIERTRDNPLQERTEIAAPAQIIGAATRGIQSLSQAITREVERNSNPRGGIPERGFDRTRDRERKRTSTGNEDGMHSNEGLDGQGW
jgi:hypothetical protein